MMRTPVINGNIVTSNSHAKCCKAVKQLTEREDNMVKYNNILHIIIDFNCGDRMKLSNQAQVTLRSPKN